MNLDRQTLSVVAPVLVEKFKTNLARKFPAKQQKAILDLCMNPSKLEKTPVNEFVDMFAI